MMKKFTDTMFMEMEQKIQCVLIQETPFLIKAERAYSAAEAALKELKVFVSSYRFSSQQERILFFKEIKPAFHSELIYWSEMVQIESGLPPGPKKAVRNYYLGNINVLRSFMERNWTLYTYHKLGRSHQDEALFVQETHPSLLFPEYHLDIDPNFSAINSIRLARILASERLVEHLQERLKQQDKKIKKSHKTESNADLTWTDSKAAFIELLYAIQSRGAVNHGRMDMKTLVNALEKTFQIDVGNFYRIFSDFIIRKKNRTPFLDALKDSFNRKIDEHLA